MKTVDIVKIYKAGGQLINKPDQTLVAIADPEPSSAYQKETSPWYIVKSSLLVAVNIPPRAQSRSETFPSFVGIEKHPDWTLVLVVTKHQILLHHRLVPTSTSIFTFAHNGTSLPITSLAHMNILF